MLRSSLVFTAAKGRASRPIFLAFLRSLVHNEFRNSKLWWTDPEYDSSYHIPGSALFIQSHWGCLGARPRADWKIIIQELRH